MTTRKESEGLRPAILPAHSGLRPPFTTEERIRSGYEEEHTGLLPVRKVERLRETQITHHYMTPAATSAKWGVHINAIYAIYRLMHSLHIKLHISAYFHCIFFAYSTNTASGKTTPWASQDIPGYPGIGFVDWDNPG